MSRTPSASWAADMGRYDSLVIDKLISRGGRRQIGGGGGGGGAASYEPILLAPADADYTTGSGVTWGTSGDAITMEIEPASSTPSKPSQLMAWKYFDTGFTMADLPQLTVEFSRVSSPETYQNRAPLIVAGIVFVPASTTPNLASHTSRTFALKCAFNSGVAYGWAKVRADGSFGWTTLSVDTTPGTYGLNAIAQISSQQRINGDKVTTMFICTACYPGSSGTGVDRNSKSDNTLVIPAATDKAYACIGAGRAASGGTGNLTVSGIWRLHKSGGV